MIKAQWDVLLIEMEIYDVAFSRVNSSMFFSSNLKIN